jgi:glycerol-3-phosphate dehydrogenase
LRREQARCRDDRSGPARLRGLAVRRQHLHDAPSIAQGSSPAAGRLAHGGLRLRLRLAATWPWATQITAAIARLQALAPG